MKHFQLWKLVAYETPKSSIYKNYCKLKFPELRRTLCVHGPIIAVLEVSRGLPQVVCRLWGCKLMSDNIPQKTSCMIFFFKTSSLSVPSLPCQLSLVWEHPKVLEDEVSGQQEGSPLHWRQKKQMSVWSLSFRHALFCLCTCSRLNLGLSWSSCMARREASLP